MSDGRLIRRVLYNLFDNAIKYTAPPGRVTVSSAGSGAWLTMTVADTGIGIPPEHLPRVSERFYRVDPARAGEAGAGLGLAICRSIARALGGTVALESRAGEGTTARLTVPLEAAGSPNHSANARTAGSVSADRDMPEPGSRAPSW